MDQETQKKLDEITSAVKSIEHKVVKLSAWRALFNGVMSGIGSIIGIVIALAIIGWVLNALDVIPAFKNTVEQWRQDFQKAQTQKIPASLVSPENGE